MLQRSLKDTRVTVFPERERGYLCGYDAVLQRLLLDPVGIDVATVPEKYDVRERERERASEREREREREREAYLSSTRVASRQKMSAYLFLSLFSMCTLTFSGATEAMFWL